MTGEYEWGTPPSASKESSWDTKDTIDTGLDIYKWYQDQENVKNQEASVMQGFNMQNPFNPYRGLYAGEMFNLQQNPGAIVNTPGYQFAYDQGLQSLFAKQAATGNRFSGQAMTESQQFGQGLASQMYNSEMERLMTLSGASFAPSGGVQTGESLSSIGTQDLFNQQQIYHNIVDRMYPREEYEPTPWNPYG